jgi:hypothetical protein
MEGLHHREHLKREVVASKVITVAACPHFRTSVIVAPI